MTLAEAEKALAVGSSLVKDLVTSGTNTVLIGEMGIGNSSSAALITACLTGSPITSCIGRGTGLDDSAMAHKVDVLGRALKRPKDALSNPMTVACEFGGFEIIMMAGAYMAAAAHRCIALVDGYISSAALLLAEKLRPGSADAVIFSHKSREQGHSLLLSHWQKRPLLDLDLALGEGTGALLALPLLRAACAMLRDMATFESAAVSQDSLLQNKVPS
jgi:nicotinate-nucleotide--dimethylbenzimidazole phosphoribosyltransferase